MAQIVVGIDIGTDTIKVVKMVPKVRQFDILDTTVINYEDDPFKVLKEYLERQDNRSTFIIAGVKSDEIFKKVIKLPFLDRSKITKVIPFQLDQKLPFKLEECHYDYYIRTDKKAKTSEIFSYVLKNEYFNSWWNSYKNLNIQLKGIIPDTIAYRNLFNMEMLKNENYNRSIWIDIGASFTRLIFMDENRIVSDKVLVIGGDDIDKDISKKFSVSIEEAKAAKHKVSSIYQGDISKNEQIIDIEKIIKNRIDMILMQVKLEIKRFEEFSQNDSLVFLLGGGSRISNIESYFENKLGIEVNKGIKNNTPTIFAKAIGYALRETVYHKDYKINFLKGDYATSVSFDTTAFKYGAQSFLYIILIVSAFFVYKWSELKMVEKKYNNIMDNTQKLSQVLIKDEVDSPEELLSLIGDNDVEEKKDLVPSRTAFDHLDRVSKLLLDAEIKVDVKLIDIELKKIDIRAELEKLEDIDNMVQALKKESCFKDIKKGKTKKRRKDNKVDIQLTINSMGCK